ncbi:MAG: hypothetical protein ACR2KP_08705 [Egibacteraceae bacterium]
MEVEALVDERWSMNEWRAHGRSFSRTDLVDGIVGEHMHIAFIAPDRAAVRAFYDTAIAAAAVAQGRAASVSGGVNEALGHTVVRDGRLAAPG